MRHNSHNIKSIFLKCTTELFLVHSENCTTIHHCVIPEYFYDPISSHSPYTPTAGPWQLLISLYGFCQYGYFRYM